MSLSSHSCPSHSLDWLYKAGETEADGKGVAQILGQNGIAVEGLFPWRGWRPLPAADLAHLSFQAHAQRTLGLPREPWEKMLLFPLPPYLPLVWVGGATLG